MTIADLTSGAAKIATAYKNMRVHWEDTKEHWHDDNRRRFEENLNRVGTQFKNGAVEPSGN